MSTDVTIQVEPSGPYISSLASAVNDARNYRDAAQSALGAVTATAADVLADKEATDAARLAAEAASIAAAASASSALGAKDGAAAAALAAANIALIHDRYRNQLNDWRALGVPDRPSLFQRFTDGTYFVDGKIVTSDFSALLTATGGTFARASSGTGMDSNGGLAEFAANLPRITDRGLLAEGSGTNLVRNPRGDGAVAGSPGTLPTYWTWTTAAALGLSYAITNVGVENGIPFIDLKIAGTTTAAGSWRLLPEPAGTSAPATGAGVAVAQSAFMRIVAGSAAGLVNIRLRQINFDGAGNSLASNYGNDVSGALSSVLTRYDYVPTTPAATATTQPAFEITFNSGQTVDLTIRIGAPQLIVAPFASSIILPPAGSPAQATRAADNYQQPRASLSSFSKLLRGRTAAGVNLSGSQILWQGDDGTSSNRLYVARDAVTGAMRVVSVAAGVTALNVSLPALGNDTPFAIAFHIATNDFAVSLNGAAVVSDASKPLPAGLVKERFGRTASDSTCWCGAILSHGEFPTLLSNSKLQALTA